LSPAQALILFDIESSEQVGALILFDTESSAEVTRDRTNF